MTNNYNLVARFYDTLSAIIFQKAIINAQIFLIQNIPEESNILIVGGGTGRVLEELAKIYSENINITYVEKSSEMISLSKKRNYKSNLIEFINLPVEEFNTDKLYDVVFTSFFFDNFQAKKIHSIFSKLNRFLKPNGLWLYADFVDDKHNKWWQKFLLKSMYIFFKLTCNIEAQNLTSMNAYFEQEYKKINEAFFYKNFIQSKIYKKI